MPDWIVRLNVAPKLISLSLLGVMLLGWHLATARDAFVQGNLSDTELMTMEFNGDIIRDENDNYIFNPAKISGIPGPMAVAKKCREEFSHPFHTNGTNDHGIAHLVWYTISRFSIGFLAAAFVGIFVGVMIGLSPLLLQSINPVLQVLKPISPLAWMPLLLYTVQKPQLTAILVVFMAAIWPTIANTAFGVSNIREDYLRVASLLQFNWFRRLFKVILPGAAPAIVAGLRISFGSALVAVVPAEMLLGELGVGYLTWIEWNNLDIAGVLFAILVVGVVGYAMDLLFNRAARGVGYAE